MESISPVLPASPSIALVDLKEAARTLNVCRSTLYRLIDRGELPTVAIGRARRIPTTAIEAFIEGNTVYAGSKQ